MVIGPIGMYFLTVNTIFSGKRVDFLKQKSYLCIASHTSIGNSTFAGILAAVTANVVLFAYIYVAWLEDQGEQGAGKEQSKKSQ